MPRLETGIRIASTHFPLIFSAETDMTCRSQVLRTQLMWNFGTHVFATGAVFVFAPSGTCTHHRRGASRPARQDPSQPPLDPARASCSRTAATISTKPHPESDRTVPVWCHQCSCELAQPSRPRNSYASCGCVKLDRVVGGGLNIHWPAVHDRGRHVPRCSVDGRREGRKLCL